MISVFVNMPTVKGFWTNQRFDWCLPEFCSLWTKVGICGFTNVIHRVLFCSMLTTTCIKTSYRVFHLLFTYFKWLYLWTLSYFDLCCKDQNWFEEWQFCLTKIAILENFGVWKINCQNMTQFSNLLSWSHGKRLVWYAKGPWFKTQHWQLKN